jgi:hypothetical protein
MAPLSSLPVEILCLVIEEVLELDCFEQVLHALSGVSRQLHELANPRLYSHFSYKDKSNDNIIHGRRLRRLVRTLLARPDLALHMRSAYVIFWEGEYLESGEAKQLLYEAEEEGGFGIFMDAISEADLLSGDQWKKDLQAGDQEPILILLIALCTNLNVLRFGPVFSAMDYFVEGMWKIASNETNPHRPGGRQLKQVIIEAYCEEKPGSLDFTNLAPFFALPHIRRIEAVGIDARYSSWMAPLPRSTVETLEIRKSAFNGDSIIQLLLAPTALRNLKIVWVGEVLEWSEFGDQHSDPINWETSKIRLALRSQQHSLESLMITHTAGEMDDLQHVDEFEIEDETAGMSSIIPHALGSLHHLTNLSFLECPISLLLGLSPRRSNQSSATSQSPRIYDLLPPSLAYLGLLKRLPEDVLSDVKYMIRNRKTYLPNLRNIEYVRGASEDEGVEAFGWAIANLSNKVHLDHHNHEARANGTRSAGGLGIDNHTDNPRIGDVTNLDIGTTDNSSGEAIVDAEGANSKHTIGVNDDVPSPSSVFAQFSSESNPDLDDGLLSYILCADSCRVKITISPADKIKELYLAVLIPSKKDPSALGLEDRTIESAGFVGVFDSVGDPTSIVEEDLLEEGEIEEVEISAGIELTKTIHAKLKWKSDILVEAE